MEGSGAHFSLPVINPAAGAVAFGGSLTGTGVNANNNNGIWSNSDGPLTLIARMGDQAPGGPAGHRIHWLSRYGL